MPSDILHNVLFSGINCNHSPTCLSFTLAFLQCGFVFILLHLHKQLPLVSVTIKFFEHLYKLHLPARYHNDRDIRRRQQVFCPDQEKRVFVDRDRRPGSAGQWQARIYLERFGELCRKLCAVQGHCIISENRKRMVWQHTDVH